MEAENSQVKSKLVESKKHSDLNQRGFSHSFIYDLVGKLIDRPRSIQAGTAGSRLRIAM